MAVRELPNRVLVDGPVVVGSELVLGVRMAIPLLVKGAQVKMPLLYLTRIL